MTEMHHPTAERLEAYVEGLLDAGDRVVLESHLLSCPRCQHEVDEWLALFAALSDLPELQPSPEFADRVMARVHIQVRAAWQEHLSRAAAFIGRFLPTTTLGWAVASAFLALPVLLAGGVIAWLATNTQATPTALWTFAAGQFVDGVRGLGAAALSAVLQTDVAAWLVQQGSAIAGAGGTTLIGAVAAAAGLMTMLSIWVLYRNLVRTPSRDSNYALFSF